MSKSSIYRCSGMRGVEYCVKAHMLFTRPRYKFCVTISVKEHETYDWTGAPDVYQTSFYLDEDLYFKAFKQTIVALSELLFPESKEKERELKEHFFNSVKPGIIREDDVLTAESGTFLYPVNKSLPTKEEIESKLSPLYEDLSRPHPIEEKVKENEKEKDKPETAPDVKIKE